jgi:hypothetical protein
MNHKQVLQKTSVACFTVACTSRTISSTWPKWSRAAGTIGGLTMEKPLYRFQAITDFSVGNAEKSHLRIDSITNLTLEIGSNIPPGRYRLVLIKPFPPLGRLGKELDRLASLHAEDIESIWGFRKPDEGQWARIEIRGKAPDTTIFVNSERIEGVPGWDETQPSRTGRTLR